MIMGRQRDTVMGSQVQQVSGFYAVTRNPHGRITVGRKRRDRFKSTRLGRDRQTLVSGGGKRFGSGRTSGAFSRGRDNGPQTTIRRLARV